VDGKIVRDADELRRFKSLAIPPAWRDVWICPLAHGHLQATGRDARDRKQHRYHPRWREVRDETKYDRMLAFAKKLPAIRDIVQAIEVVAKRLGNTKAVCRKCYIHRAVIDAYTDGSLLPLLRRPTKKARGSGNVLASEEAAVLTLLSRKKLVDRRHNGSNLRRQLKQSLRGTKSA
jgi:DNA topoisomerase IB